MKKRYVCYDCKRYVDDCICVERRDRLNKAAVIGVIFGVAVYLILYLLLVV